MLGLGEQDDEIIDAMLDLRDVGEPEFLLSHSARELSGYASQDSYQYLYGNPFELQGASL